MTSPKQKPKREPFAQGRYSVYETDEGGAVLAYRPDGDEADLHQPIPAGIWKIMLSAMKGEPIDLNPMQLLKLMMGK